MFKALKLTNFSNISILTLFGMMGGGEEMGDGGPVRRAKMPPLLSFLNIFKTKKGKTLPFYDF